MLFMRIFEHAGNEFHLIENLPVFTFATIIWYNSFIDTHWLVFLFFFTLRAVMLSKPQALPGLTELL